MGVGLTVYIVLQVSTCRSYG